MKKINLKGITAESVTGVLILTIALINAVLQIFGFHMVPIANEEISEIISALFLTISAFYNVYKNRNITTASQKAQEITNALKSGELFMDDVDRLLEKIKNNADMACVNCSKKPTTNTRVDYSDNGRQ